MRLVSGSRLCDLTHIFFGKIRRVSITALVDLGDESGVDLCSVPVQMDDITEKLPVENRILFGIEIHVIERNPVAVGNGLISGMHVVHISGMGEQNLGKGR